MFVDGQHANEFIMSDTHAVVPYMRDNGVILYHDILQTNIMMGFEKLIEIYAGQFEPMLLERTPSGMGIFCSPNTPEKVKEIMSVFHDPVAGISFEQEN